MKTCNTDGHHMMFTRPLRGRDVVMCGAVLPVLSTQWAQRRTPVMLPHREIKTPEAISPFQ
eukprot:gene20898-7777_t